MNGRTDKLMDRWRAGGRDGWMDGWMDGQRRGKLQRGSETRLLSTGWETPWGLSAAYHPADFSVVLPDASGECDGVDLPPQLHDEAPKVLADAANKDCLGELGIRVALLNREVDAAHVRKASRALQATLLVQQVTEVGQTHVLGGGKVEDHTCGRAERAPGGRGSTCLVLEAERCAHRPAPFFFSGGGGGGVERQDDARLDGGFMSGARLHPRPRCVSPS